MRRATAPALEGGITSLPSDVDCWPRGKAWWQAWAENAAAQLHTANARRISSIWSDTTALLGAGTPQAPLFPGAAAQPGPQAPGCTANFPYNAIAKKGEADTVVKAEVATVSVLIADVRAAGRCPRWNCPQLRMLPYILPPYVGRPAADLCDRCGTPQVPGSHVLVCIECVYYMCIPCRDQLATQRAQWVPRRYLDNG